MNYSVELALIVLLVVVMYYRPAYLRELTSHPLAKLLMIGVLVAMTHVYGRNAGILTALILVLMMHNVFEGMENKGDDNTDDSGEESEGETSDEDEEDTNMVSEEDEEPVHQVAKTTADLISSDPSDLRNKDKMVANPDAAGANQSEDEPVAMGKDSKKPIQEGFSLYY
jgi:hypothetical protein